MSDKVNVSVYDSTFDGLVILNPENVRKMSNEGLEELIAWFTSTQAALLKPRSCPFCKGPV